MERITSSDREALRELSAHVGRDLLLVQGAGGNSSVKDEHSLLVKGSGACLADAKQREIFVSLDQTQLRDLIARGVEDLGSAVRSASPQNLKPSIETFLHALLPHRFVLHTHALHTIVCAVRIDAESVLQTRLEGLNWCYVPYVRPGLPLQREANVRLQQKGILGECDVLVLGNHGLVVGGSSAERVLYLTEEVERRLATPQRAPRLEAEDSLLSQHLAASTGAGFRLPRCYVSHALAFDEEALAVASRGSLYPDHVVFLGSAIAVSGEGRDASIPPKALAVRGSGLLLDKDSLPAADDLLHLLSEIATRLSCSDPIRYLSEGEELALVNWEAEKSRVRALCKTNPPKPTLPNHLS